MVQATIIIMIFMRINQTLSFYTAHSATRTAQNWLDHTVRICPHVFSVNFANLSGFKNSPLWVDL